MKIYIKIDHDALVVVCDKIENMDISVTNVEQKVVSSIMYELTKKLLKKEIDKRGSNERFKISLKYYEAFALERVCRGFFESGEGSHYGLHVCHKLSNDLIEQL